MKIKFLLFSIVILFVGYCGSDPIPVGELGFAKRAIAKAEAARADKYDKGNYDKAKEWLFEAHANVEREKMDEAKKNAITSREYAEKAYAKSAPLLASDTKKEANILLAQAQERNAEEFAQEEYNNATTMVSEGDKLYSSNDYDRAFQKYEAAREEAQKASNIAESQAEIMKRDVLDIEDTLREAESYGALDLYPNKFDSAKSKGNSAKENIEALKLKIAYSEIKEAKKLAKEVLLGSQEDWATKKNKEAHDVVSKVEEKFNTLNESLSSTKEKSILDKSVETQDAFKATEDTMAAAKESLQSSDSALGSQAYKDSYNQSEEAIRLAKIVDEQIPQVQVLLANAANVSSNGSGYNIAGKGWKKYKVRLIPENRDCLWKISAYKFHYNNAKLWPKIYKANKSKIKNPDLIFPGQVFAIPPKKGSLRRNKNVIKNNTAKKGAKDTGTAEDTSKNVE